MSEQHMSDGNMSDGNMKVKLRDSVKLYAVSLNIW